ncbi:MAG TPA: glycine reductase [Firmicutes bacterium]|nr:glycine reductase [Bacillota bacterium]
MRLKEVAVEINRVEFGDVTGVAGQTLTICKDELIALINEENAFAAVEIELAAPGESCRIIQVADIIQPRVKTEGSGQVFPGVISPMEQVGSGTTVVLEGVAVLETWQYPGKFTSVLDMSGPAAALSHFSKLWQVVLIARPHPEISMVEYARALKKAGLRAAKYLAEAAVAVTPARETVYDLNASHVSPELPRVAYVCQLYSIREADEPLVYGHNVKNLLPTIMHPNEFLDGAVVNNDYENIRISEPTYTHQNHPVIKELYRRHGKDLNFVGVILKDAPLSLDDKKRSALMAAKVAKLYLQVDGVVITKEGGGHPQLDMALTADACAAQGIETVIMIAEFISGSGKGNEMTLFNSKAANAIISTGKTEQLQLPKMDRVIGMRVTDSPQDPFYAVFFNGGLSSNQSIRGAVSQVGENRLTAVEY